LFLPPRLVLPPVSAAALLLMLVGAPTASAHSAQEVGTFHVEIGWLTEPALVGQPNAVQLTIKDHDEKPLTDLGPDDLKVVVSTGGRDSDSLSLVAAFDVEEGKGPLGEYDAELIPTSPGDYTFHVTGKIRDAAADLSVTSSDETFDPVVGSSDLEFPVKQPTLTEVGTRLDRLDARIAALQSAPAPDQRAIADVAAAAVSAKQAAEQALLGGVLIGGIGVILAVVAIALAARSRRAAGAA
jgi:hypothetical protein